jgi:hypothetical protein
MIVERFFERRKFRRKEENLEGFLCRGGEEKETAERIK